MQDSTINMEKVMPDRIENQYKISVVIPVYNREQTIKRCIDSIFSQTYPVFEIIVVDDGSTDKTLDIVQDEYGTTVTVIRQKHKGAQAARNAGIRAAKGEYIAFLDSDDEWLPKKIELQVQKLDENADVVVCGDGYIQMDWKDNIPPAIYRDAGGIKENVKMGKRKPLRMNGKNGYIYKHVLERTFGDFDSLMTSKKNLLDIGPLDEKVPALQEWDLLIRLAKQNQIAYIKKPLFVYHLHDGETISQSPEKSIDGMEYIIKKHTQEIIKIHGLRGLNRHYKNLLKLAAKCRSKKTMAFLIKVLQIYVLILADKLRNIILIGRKQKKVQ